MTAVGNVRTGEVLVFGDTEFATAVDPGMAQVIDLDWKDGSQEVFSNLGEDGVFVDDSFADDHDLERRLARRVTFAERDDEARSS